MLQWSELMVIMENALNNLSSCSLACLASLGMDMRISTSQKNCWAYVLHKKGPSITEK